MKCYKCGVDKSEADFPFMNKAKNERNVVCKECQREYKRKHYYKKKEEHYARNRKMYAKLREYVDSQKDKCIICGEEEKVCLDFHHVKGGKKEAIANLVRGGSLRKLKEEIEKCVILCANCHRKVHGGVVKLVS